MASDPVRVGKRSAAALGAHCADVNCIDVDASTSPVVGVATPVRLSVPPAPTCARTRSDAARGVDVAGSNVRGGGVARAARRNGATPTLGRKVLGSACIAVASAGLWAMGDGYGPRGRLL